MKPIATEYTADEQAVIDEALRIVAQRAGSRRPLRIERSRDAAAHLRLLPVGITRRAGGYRVTVHVRPFTVATKTFPSGTPLAEMRIWRDAKRAELMARRAAETETTTTKRGSNR